jgi:hypothetical protein
MGSVMSGIYVVETLTICDGWVNTWTEDYEGPDSMACEVPQEFFTPEDAFRALAEFFEDLSRADMDGYNPKHYRVVEMSEEVEVIRRT